MLLDGYSPLGFLLPTPDACWRRVHLPALRRSPLMLCSLYAPDIGYPVDVRLAFWTRLRASMDELRQRFPACRFLLAGDCNVWLPGLLAACTNYNDCGPGPSAELRCKINSGCEIGCAPPAAN